MSEPQRRILVVGASASGLRWVARLKRLKPRVAGEDGQGKLVNRLAVQSQGE